MKKLCTSLRRNAKEERVLFHYNGHGVPRPTVNGEIWVFNKVSAAGRQAPGEPCWGDTPGNWRVPNTRPSPAPGPAPAELLWGGSWLGTDLREGTGLLRLLFLSGSLWEVEF